MPITIANIISFLAPLGIKFAELLIDELTEKWKDKKKAKAETQEMLLEIYNDLNSNMAALDMLRPDRLRLIAVNSPECILSP